MDEQQPRGRIEVNAIHDNTDSSVFGQRTTVSVDDIMSITEATAEVRGVRIVLMEQIPSEVPWIFRTDDDAPAWRTLWVSEEYDTVLRLIRHAESQGGLWSTVRLDEELVKQITTQENITMTTIRLVTAMRLRD